MGTFHLYQTMLLSGGLSDYITLNTLFGAVVVLAILFLIICGTYFVNIKPHLKDNTSVTVNPGSSVSNANMQTDTYEQEELVDDSELVAVITAAIYASMGEAVPADGFVVRSIRRVNGKKWMSA